jgi:hypothetical protein
MYIDLKGTVKEILAQVQLNDNFSKQELVVITDEDTQYPQEIIAQATNTKIDELKGLAVGDKVIVKCNLRGNKSKEGRYFNQLVIWKIEKEGN